MKKNKKKIRINYLNLISSLLDILLVVFTVSIIYLLVKINVVKMIFILAIGLIISLIDLFLILNNRTKNKVKKVLNTILSFVFVVIYSFIIFNIINTVKFVSNITSSDSEYQTYLVVVKPNKYEKISNLNNKTIGFINNSYTDDVKNTLANKSKIQVVSKDFSNKEEIIDSLNNDSVSAIVIENNYNELLKENEEDVFSNLRVIYTFKVKIERDNIVSSKFNPKEPFILYISGSDSRGKITDVARSDVNILAVVNPNKNKILLVNIPRDYYVQLHGTSGTKDKLTHAGIYGIDKSKNTISDLLDINIDYYLKVGFNTVIKSVDLVGGIDIDSDKEFTAHANKNCKFTKGVNHVNGECALAFSRERYAYESGDRHRGENQQQVIIKMLNKASNTNILTKYNNILKSLDGSFDSNMSYENITDFIREESLDLSKYKVESIGLDGSGDSRETYSMGSQKLYVMISDESTIEKAKENIKKYLQK